MKTFHHPALQFASHEIYLEWHFDDMSGEEYIDEMVMEECFPPEGSAREHAAILRAMNNDGSWRIRLIRGNDGSP